MYRVPLFVDSVMAIVDEFYATVFLVSASKVA